MANYIEMIDQYQRTKNIDVLSKHQRSLTNQQKCKCGQICSGNKALAVHQYDEMQAAIQRGVVNAP